MSNQDEYEIKIPKVLISYSWSSKEYEQWIVDFATKLRTDGVDVFLDKWDLRFGNDEHAFEEMLVSKDIDKVLIMCDEKYQEKADNRSGGVGKETQIITPEIYNKIDQNKFIPIVSKKDKNGKVCIPIYLKTRIYVDLVTDFDEGYKKLLHDLFGVPEYPKPELGKPPIFLQKLIENKEKKELNSIEKIKHLYDGKLYIASSNQKNINFSSDYIKKEEGSLGIWVYFDKDKIIKSIENNRYIFAHSTDNGRQNNKTKRFCNVFALSLTPNVFHGNATDVRLKMYISNENGYEPEGYDDPFLITNYNNYLKLGWNYLVIRWSLNKDIIELIVNGESSYKINNIKDYLPKEFDESVYIGRWTDPLQHYNYINDFIKDPRFYEYFITDEEINQIIANNPDKDKILPGITSI